MKSEQANKTAPLFQYLVLGLILIVSWLLQSAPGNLLAIASVRPVLLVVFAVCIGAIYGELTGGVFGLIAGMLMDLYTVPSLAFHAAVLTAVGIVCGLAVRHLLMNRFFSVLVLCLVMSFCYFTLYWLLFKVLMGGGGWTYFCRFSLPGTVYTALTGLIYAPLIWWIRRCFQR